MCSTLPSCLPWAALQAETLPDLSRESSLPGSPKAAPSYPNDQGTEAITKPIFDAIADCKVALMVKIDHIATECNLIRHDLDKIGGQLPEAEDCQGMVEDSSVSHSTQLPDL